MQIVIFYKIDVFHFLYIVNLLKRTECMRVRVMLTYQGILICNRISSIALISYLFCCKRNCATKASKAYKRDEGQESTFIDVLNTLRD